MSEFLLFFSFKVKVTLEPHEQNHFLDSDDVSTVT